MTAPTVTCPNCRTSLKLKSAPPPGTTVATCPNCMGAVPLTPPTTDDTDLTSALPPAPPASPDTSATVTTGGVRDDSFSAAPAAPGAGEFPFLAPAQQPDELGRLGSYRVLGKLGAGGMGAVFRAEDPTLRRQVALKVMLPQYATNSTAKARFLREARAQAAVEHDHIIAIYQVGEEAGVPYIAMPLLKGMTLADALKANPHVPVGEAMRIAREMAAGLAAAHEQGLIHRDIKPANVWLEGKHRRVKILDFGLARAETDGDATEQVTQEGMIVGTPAYMSPEQAQGEAVDARTDLFSLGVVLYQMLAARQPFSGKNTPAILMQVVSHNPPRPVELNPQVPPELDALTMHLMAKAPEQRPANAEAVVEALKAIEGAMNRTAQIPVVMYAPPAAAVAAPAAPDPWESIANTDPEMEPPLSGSQAVATPEANPTYLAAGLPAARSPVSGPPWALIGSVLAFVAVAAVAGFALMNKDKPDVGKAPEEPPTATPKPAPPKKPTPATDPDRKAAERAIALGGLVFINDAEQEYRAVADLPREPFRLTTLTLAGPAITDEACAAFSESRNLTQLNLSNAAVTDAGLAHFRGCRNLRSLNLTDSARVTDAGVLHFKDCPDIGQLLLTNTQVGDEGLAMFKDRKNLGAAMLSGTRVTDEGLASLKMSYNLLILALRKTRVTDAGLAHLSGNKNFQVLHLEDTPVTDAGLEHLKGCTALTTLSLDGAGVTDAGLEHLKGCAKLDWLSLGGTKVTGTGLEHLKGCTAIQTLRLHACPITDATLPHLKQFKGLCQLFIGYTQVTDAGVGTLRECEKLHSLDIEGVSLTDAALESLRGMPSLIHLKVTKTKVTAKGIEAFAKAMPRCKIEWDGGTIEPVDVDRKAAELALSLGGHVQVSEHGNYIHKVADLSGQPFTLTGLGLQGTPASDADLAGFKLCTGLTSLNLSRTRVSEAGLAYFKDCKSLSYLSLANLKLADAALANFRDCRDLAHLDLEGTQVGDGGLAAVQDFKSLRSLNVRKSKVTAKGVEAFAKAMPRCKIEWDGVVIEPKPADDRKAAEFALSLGGAVRVGEPEREVKAVGDLPKEPFVLTGLSLLGGKATDADLTQFKDCRSLKELRLDGPKVTDAGLANFKGHTAIVYINLSGTGVTDAGLAHFKDCAGLAHLDVGDTRVGDVGLSHVKQCKQLAYLGLGKTQVTDAGLEALGGLVSLRHLSLDTSRVTKAGVEKLAAALPQCRITWDGGTVGPKQ